MRRRWWFIVIGSFLVTLTLLLTLVFPVFNKRFNIITPIEQKKDTRPEVADSVALGITSGARVGYVTLVNYCNGRSVKPVDGDGYLNNITAHLRDIINPVTSTVNVKGALYEYVDHSSTYAGDLIAETSVTNCVLSYAGNWFVFDFETEPYLTNNTNYYLAITAEAVSGTNARLNVVSTSGGTTDIYENRGAYGFEDPWAGESASAGTRMIGGYYTPVEATWSVTNSSINGSFYNVTSWSILINTINGSFYNSTSWGILSNTINGSFYNNSYWEILSSSINGSFYNNTAWKTISDTVNGSFYNVTSWVVLSSSLNGSFYNISGWNIIDDEVNGSFYNNTIWMVVSDTINGSFYNVSDWILVSNTVNGSFYNNTGWTVIDDTVNGSFYNLTTWGVLSDTINGSFYNVTSWSILIDTINGSFYNISSASWKTLDGSINGSFYNNTEWIILVDSINGSFFNHTSWGLLDGSINGSFYNVSDWIIITNTINGSFWNNTNWDLIDNSINGSFYNTSSISNIFNINLYVINPNPGNGTHGTNYLKMNASGLTTSVDVTCINFTTPPALIPGSASYEFDSESRSNGACMWNTSAVYNDAWANATGSAAPGPLYVGQYEMAGDYTITRSYLIFDTSGLPDEAVIDSAYVSLVLFSDHSAVDFNVVIQQVKPPAPHSPLAPGDYNKGNFPPSATYANENISGFTDDDRFNLSLNASGIAEIDAAGYTYFVIRSDQDLIASAPGVGSDEWVMFYAPGGVIPEYAPHLIINYTIPSSNWQHIVNLTFYTNESGMWVAYNTTHVDSNGTVTVPAAWADSNDTYFWVCEWESNGTNIGASDVWSFETVNMTSGGGGILPIGGVGDASMNYLLLVAIGSFSICMIFFNRKRKKK